MNLFKLSITFLLVVLLQIGIYSQKNHIPDNYSIIVVKKRGRNPREIGDIKDFNSNSVLYDLYSSDETIVQDFESIKKIYLNKYIRVFPKSKFHYKAGNLINTSFGFGPAHSNIHLSLNKRLNFFEYGIGIGRFTNWYNLPIGFNTIQINSNSLYFNSKYILNKNKGKRAFYGRAKIGYNFNRASFRVDNVTNGILLEPSIGITFSSKRRIKHYFEISQHISNAKGNFTIPTATSNIPITGSFDLLFNRTVFTYGIELGKSGNKKQYMLH